MNKNILVTGASTGIGYSISTHLAENGYSVYAGARKQEDIDRLSEIDCINGLKLEVTNQDDIDKSVRQLADNGGLFAIVNNAGIAGSAALLDMPLEQHSYQFEVNVFSHLHLFRSFFEQLKQNKGKIINISSISSFMAGSDGAYRATKKAVDSYSEQLKTELSKFDIDVSVIQPGFFETAIFNNLKELSNQFQHDSKYYKDDYIIGSKNFDEIKNANIKDPILVSKKVLQILKQDKSPIYNIVGNRNEETWSFEAMMNKIKQMNEGLDTPWTMDELLKTFKKIISS